jgi:DnaJ like chaperone protein
LAREHHPDLLMAQGLPQEFIDVANDKLAAINNAYGQIRRERGMK